MALGLDPAAPGACGRLYRHRCGWRCRVRGQRDAPPHAAPGETALRLGRVVDLKVLGHPGARSATPADRQGASAPSTTSANGHADRRGACLGGRATGACVAAGIVAQRHECPVARALLRRPGHARPTTGATRGSRPKSGCCANAITVRRRASSTSWWTCPPPRRCAPSCSSRTSGGRLGRRDKTSLHLAVRPHR